MSNKNDVVEEGEDDEAVLPDIIDNGEVSGKVIIAIPKGGMVLCISPTKLRTGYGVNLLANMDPTLSVTLAQSIYALMSGCIEAIRYKKESLFRLAIIAERKRKAMELDPDDILWNKETPKQYLEESGVKGNA